MATGLDLIREQNPALALIPDDELIEQILQQYQGDLDPDTFVESLLNEMPVESPIAPPTGGKRAFAPSDEPSQIGFGQALVGPAKSSWARSWGPSITRLRGGIAGLFGYEDTAEQLYQQAAEQDKNILQDSGYVSFAQATKGPDAGVSTFVKAGLSATGQSSPYLIEGITGALAGAKIGRFAGPLGLAVGAGVGAAVASFPRLFEFNVSRQQEQVNLGNLDGVNEGLAAITALPQAAAESFMFPLMGKLLGPLTRSQMSNILSQATLGRVAKGSSVGIVTEAATEVGQQVLERYQAGLPIDTPEAIAEYTEAAYAGGFVGGLLGGVTTGAGEAVRATQPKPPEQKIEEPKIQEGIQQKPEATVLPEEQKAQSVNLAKEEEVKPATFNVEQQGDKFALNRIDDTGKKTTVGGPFNTQEEATAKQQEVENQKSKLSQQTFFTKDEIIKENPAIGNIINELEEQGNTIAPHVKQVYFQKNLALPKGDFSNVQASGGTSNSIVDGWFDRTRDYVAIGTADLSKASETVAHENFHALQRQVDRGYTTGLFKQDEQAALDTFLPGGTIDSIAPSVQKGLGKDVMNRLRERHADRTITNREMQAYAFGAYSSMKSQGKRIAAPNPVIRAFQRLFELIKRAGNVFRKNKVNNVQDLFEKARTGEIGKRAVPKKGIEKLQTEGIAQAEEVAAKGLAPLTSKELSITTPIIDKAGKTFSTILPTISPIGEFVAKQSYQRGLGGARLQKVIDPYANNAVSKSDIDGGVYSKALTDIQSNETELNQNKEYISIRDAEGNSTTLGDTSGRFVNKDYGQPELERLGNAYGTLLKVQAPTLQYALSTIPVRKKPPKISDKPTVKQLGEYFDKNRGTPLDYNVKKDFDRGVKNAVKEINYQLEQADSGKSWYDERYQNALKNVESVLPEMKDPAFRDVFTALVALTSPGSKVYTNFKVATLLGNEFAKTGQIPNVNPETGKLIGGPVGQNTKTNLSLANQIIQEKGIDGFRDFIFGESTYQELVDIKKASGLYKGKDIGISKQTKTRRNPETNKIEPNVITNFSIFGPKVNNFFLNLNGTDLKATQDIWFSRFFYRHFTDKIVDKTVKTGLKDSPKNPSDDAAMQRFMDAVRDETGFTKRDAQAVAWYYEQGLYTDLGVKSIPFDFEKVSDRVVTEINEGKYGEKRTKPIRKISPTKVKTRATKEETELSVSEVQPTEESQRKIDDGEVPQFSLSAPEKIFKEISGVANDKVQRKPTDFYNKEDLKNKVMMPRLNVLGKFGEYLVTKDLVFGKADNTFWLFDNDGELVGTLELTVEQNNILSLDAISVPSDLQGQGLGTKLLGILNDMADREGARIEGRIDPFNKKGLNKKQLEAWYKKNGYAVDADKRISREPIKTTTIELSGEMNVIPTEFSLSEYNESDAIQYSVSDKLLSDKEIQDSELPSNVKAKLFLNRDIKKGTPISVRPNLNGRVIKGEDKLFVQTIHPGNDLNKALAYDGAVTLTNPELYVSQRARANIASKKQNKFPMAAGRGLYSTKEPSLEGQVLNFNPMTGHLFVDSSGYAVKSIKGDATFFNTKVYTEGELEYYTPENAPKPLENIETQVLFKPDEVSEMDTLSKEKLVEYNLEFSTSPNDFNENSDLKDFFSRINPPRQRRTIAGHWKSFTDYTRANFYQGAVDQYSSVKKYIGEEPYKAMTMTYSSAGATESALLYGVPFLDKDGAIDLKEGTAGTGLFTRFEKLGKDLPDFLAWVAAKRAEKIYESGKETGLGSIESIRAGTKLNKGREKKFNEALRDLNVFNEAFLKIGRDSGYLSQQAYNEWTSDGGYNFYVPFYRLLEDKDSNSGPKAAEGIVNQPEYKSYKGANIPVQDLLSNVIRNYNFLTEASLKNLAGRKALEQGSKVGVAREVSFGEKSKDAVFVRKNGKQVFYEVENDLVLKSLHALNWGGYQNFAMGTLRKFKRWLTYGVTASPAFRIRNLIRDTMHSIAVGKLSYNPLGNVLDGYKGMSGGEKSELRAKMGFGGGEIHFGHIYGNDPNATKMLLDRAIDLNTVMQSDGWTAAGRKALNKGLGKAVIGWNELGSFAENINRAALYKQLKDKGVSHFEASYQARDLLNFSRHGASPIIRILTQSVPFLNARIQGLDKAGRAFFSGQRTQLLTTLGAYSLASVALYLMFKDDEDFKDREQWDRDTYHWFKLPGSETAFRIPRPFEVGAVGVMFERMMEQMVDDDVHGELLRERALHVILETFSFDVRPQLITPMLEVYSNKDTFTKRPIESMWMKKLPASERKFAYTSSAYVNTAKILEKVSWNQIQFSPVQMEHLVEGYFGWMGSSIAQVISFKDYPRKFTEFTSAESPLFMGFVKSTPSMRTKYNTQFYDAMNEMNEVNALMNMYMKNGDTDKAMKIYNKNKNLLAWRSTYVKTNTQITKINRQIKLIQSQKNLSEREKYNKVKQLKLLKTQIVRTLSENVLAYEKANNTRVKRPLSWN